MTREEKKKAIDALKISAPVRVVTQEEFNDYIHTLNKIMDWLEQEPCEDCISRQAVLDLLHSKFADGFDYDRWWNSMTVLYAINKVPPVQPIRPKGKWIYQEGHFPVMWKCSECGMMWGLHTDYCPACGAKMETEE
jgi:hypothetical protein